MVVSTKFFAFEELYGSLVELQNNDFIEEAEAFDIAIGALHIFCQARNLLNFALLWSKEGPDGFFPIFQFP